MSVSMATSFLDTSASLTGLPVEILLDVYQHLDLDSIFHLATVNKSFFNFFQKRKASILLPVLSREFSPLDELLQVYTASADDLQMDGGLYKPRRIVFKRFAGDSGQVLAPQNDLLLPLLSHGPPDGFTRVSKVGRLPSAPASGFKSVVLTEVDLDAIVRSCKLVRQWEGLFPQMRWFQEPENCRTLRSEESFRFRRAFYRWWLYGIYFHGDLPRPRIGLPEPYIDDVRTSQMRYYATSELLELLDLTETMKDVILHYICPRLDHNQQHAVDGLPLVEHKGRGHSLANGWIDQSSWGRIVKTYAKLGPKELMHFFDNIYSYPRRRLITEVRLQLPNFTFDQESIQIAIRCALDERQWLTRGPSLAEDSFGGILDFDDERDDEREAFGNDASPDGSLPTGSGFVRSYSQYSPRGDDGSYLEEYPRQLSWGSPFLASNTLGALV